MKRQAGGQWCFAAYQHPVDLYLVEEIYPESTDKSEHPDRNILAGNILYVVFYNIPIDCIFQLLTFLVLSSYLECYAFNLEVRNF